MNEDDPLMSRASAAIAEGRLLVAAQQSLLDEMAFIYQRRLQSAARAAKGLRRSEEDLVGRYGGARLQWQDRPV
jgi:hypothetical protein